MATFEALYYPSFEPSAKWLRSFLLFFDKVNSIVPDDANFTPSRPIAEIIDSVPNAFGTISPRKEDIVVDDVNLSRMRKAFKVIKSLRYNSEVKRIEITVGEEGVRIAGQVFLHDSKMSQSVRDLLKEFELIDPDLEPLAESIGVRDFTLVDETAGDLIVSHVADNIGRRYGLNTITDRRLDFIVTALNAMESKSILEPESLLACSIINVLIPQEIQNISTNQYKQIRDAYSDIRVLFQRVVIELASVLTY